MSLAEAVSSPASRGPKSGSALDRLRRLMKRRHSEDVGPDAGEATEPTLDLPSDLADLPAIPDEWKKQVSWEGWGQAAAWVEHDKSVMADACLHLALS